VDAQVQAALIAALATIVAALITTAGRVYVEMRRRRMERSQEPIDETPGGGEQLDVEQAEAPADAARRDRR
jgi:hypothetical protein